MTPTKENKMDMLDQLDKLIAEAKAEAEAAEQALNSLRAARACITGAPEPPRAVTRKRKRAKRGQREGQFLRAVHGHPTRTVPEHARAIGISTPQAYDLARRLEAKGRITKETTTRGKVTYRYERNA